MQNISWKIYLQEKRFIPNRTMSSLNIFVAILLKFTNPFTFYSILFTDDNFLCIPRGNRTHNFIYRKPQTTINKAANYYF